MIFINNSLTNNDLPGVSSKTNEIEVALNKVDNHSFPYNLSIYWLLAEGPCVARGKKFTIFLAHNTHRLPMSVRKKIQPNRSSRLAGSSNIYMNVWFYYIDLYSQLKSKYNLLGKQSMFKTYFIRRQQFLFA